MGWLIILEDGTDLYASNAAFSSALCRIGGAIVDTAPAVARWLLDLSERGWGYRNLDLRGFDEAARAAFWRGVEAVTGERADWDLAANFSPTIDLIRTLAARRPPGGVLVGSADEPITLDDLWFDDAAFDWCDWWPRPGAPILPP